MAHTGLVVVFATALLVASTNASPLPISHPESVVGTASETAKPASYSRTTANACLKDVAFRNCGYAPLTNFLADIDLGCCEEEHDYSSMGQNFLGSMSPAAGTCSTEISIDIVPFLEFLALPTPPSFGQYVKIGKAWTDCTFNGHADDCHGPLCDNMRTSGQGDIYIVAAKASVQRYFPNFQGTCAIINPFIGSRMYRLKTGDTERDAKRGISSYEDLIAMAQEIMAAVGKSGQKSAAKAAAMDGNQQASTSMYRHGYDEGIIISAPQAENIGLAIVVSGNMRVINGPEKIEEVGLWEYTPAFVALTDPLISGDAAVLQQAFNFAEPPKVHPGKAQLQFYKEETY